MSVAYIFRKKGFYITLILLIILIGYAIYIKIANDRYEADKAFEEDKATMAGTSEDIGRRDTYSHYLEVYQEADRPKYEVEIDLLNYSKAEKTTKQEIYEEEDHVLISAESGYVEWVVDMPEAGLYNIYIEYFPVQSRGTDIQRALLINGEIPFQGADTLVFSRIWTDGGEVKKDNRGNELRPSQVEAPRWQNTYFKDYMGYDTEPYLFYLEKGANVIRLEASSEPVAYRKIVICQKEELKSYTQYISGYDLSKYQNTEKEFQYIKQGEDAEYRSSPTLYANFDRASSNTEPYSASKIVLNNIGGEAWRIAGQWIEWQFDVPEDGLYNISFKGRQNYNRGTVSNRKIYIDGNTPFEEVAVVPFKYSTGWKLTTLADETGVPYQIPLTKGVHTLRMEVTLGDMGSILSKIEESLYRLNAMYRKILVLTGSKPDTYRDYRIDKVYPELIVAMEKEAATLDDIVNRLKQYSGQKGAEAAVAYNISNQLKRFIKNPDSIPRSMESFKLNISSLGTSMLNLSNSQLDIDYIIISADGTKLPKVKETLAGKIAHEFRSFIASFFEDYTTIGNVYEEGETIEVWLLSGRDQSMILKSLIDETFTPQTGIGVNVKLVGADALLPAVVAGNGPDVALTVTNNIPVDYALRGAALDISQFDDFNEVASEFYEQALVPYTFQGKVYGLPETQNFNVLFYRTDIIEQLGVELPQTWDDVIELLPVLHKNNMTFAVPSFERQINGIVVPDYSGLLGMIYQNGGQIYNEEGTKTLLDTDKSVEAFEDYTMLFTHYGAVKIYEFANRFRIGEMPIGMADYNNFNLLTVFAPEIRGLWDFALVPGTMDEEGNINRSVPSWGNASLILSSTENKEASWAFLKWWANSETNLRFARELESIIGSSARYTTANKVAFEGLAWNTDQASVIKEQWQYVFGIPEVPGGYYTTRHLTNAYRKVTYGYEDARETLLDYTRTINDEIEFKRKELGLKLE